VAGPAGNQYGMWEVFYYNSVDDSLTSHLVVRTAVTNR
jgi:hypothetical protein